MTKRVKYIVEDFSHVFLADTDVHAPIAIPGLTRVNFPGFSGSLRHKIQIFTV
jgi:hypothetical protein